MLLGWLANLESCGLNGSNASVLTSWFDGYIYCVYLGECPDLGK